MRQTFLPILSQGHYCQDLGGGEGGWTKSAPIAAASNFLTICAAERYAHDQGDQRRAQCVPLLSALAPIVAVRPRRHQFVLQSRATALRLPPEIRLVEMYPVTTGDALALAGPLSSCLQTLAESRGSRPEFQVLYELRASLVHVPTRTAHADPRNRSFRHCLWRCCLRRHYRQGLSVTNVAVRNRSSLGLWALLWLRRFCRGPAVVLRRPHVGGLRRLRFDDCLRDLGKLYDVARWPRRHWKWIP